MEIELTIAKNLVTRALLEQKGIPCVCRVGLGHDFEIDFIPPLPEAHGIVSNWDRKKIEERAPAGAGGRYTHYCFGKLSLMPIEGRKYAIVDLIFFYEDFGWCPVVVDGEYGPIGSFWDEEE
ncbi:hypothetical protein [Rhizobium lusitanum]|uniref:Uncharacterized protein n=1 Tax=Rhizobium lusitanum TaxID=293958 RepID=A0A7X0IZ84_9HYPH|nr:hypothetical protein [Rhizobium lusitanum]MBB6488461.1 hypothetical protein [Rhizobium lusitanum]